MKARVLCRGLGSKQKSAEYLLLDNEILINRQGLWRSLTRATYTPAPIALRTALVGLLILAFTFTAGAPSKAQVTTSTTDQESEILRQVRADIRAERWGEAQARLDAAASRMQGIAEYHFLRGAVLFRRQELASALREVERAITIDPQPAHYYVLRGQMYAKVGDLDSAQREYRKSIELAPTSTRGVFLLVQLLLEERRPGEALAVLEGAIKHVASDPGLHFELGRVNEVLRRPGEALASYQRAVALKPTFALAHVGVGRVYRDRPETLAKSAQHLRRAVALEPQNPLCHYELGLTYLRQGNVEGARVALETATELNPKDANILATLSSAYRQLKMFQKAAEVQQRAFLLTQQSKQELHRLAELETEFRRAQDLEFSGRSEEAARIYQKMLEGSSAEPQVLFALARLYLNAGQSPKALDYIRQALKLEPNKADYHELCGMALVELNRLPEAEQELGTAVVLQPASDAAYHALGNILVKTGRIREAISALEEAVRLAPAEPSYRLSLSAAYRQNGDVAGAEREHAAYERITREQPTEPK